MSTLNNPSESRGFVVAIIIAGFLISAVIYAARTDKIPSREPAPVVSVMPSLSANDNISVAITAGDPMLGSASAPVTVVEFSDFTSPACRQFHQSAFLDIKKNLIDSGRVRWIYKDFPLSEDHPRGRTLAEAARCAGKQGKFWEYTERLFYATDLNALQFVDEAQVIGLNVTEFTACMNDRAKADAVTESIQDAISSGITSSPSFVINGKLYEGTLSYDTLQGIVESLPSPNP